MEKQYITQSFKSGGRKNGFLCFLIVAAVAFGLLLWCAWLGGEQPMQIREIAVQPQKIETGSRH
jgi:hypothetical protein